MPREPRLDTRSVLCHVISRAVENQDLFVDRADYYSFVSRLASVFQKTGVTCFAWALMPNHLHLLLRSENRSLSEVMSRLLTGHAVYFNLRHGRKGHLFGNRFKSIICDEESYLLELIRYIHLNPLRVGLVKDLAGLDAYPFTGHAALIGKISNSWQAVDEVLSYFASTRRRAMRIYRDFVGDGISEATRYALSNLDKNPGGTQDEHLADHVVRPKSARGMPEKKEKKMPAKKFEQPDLNTLLTMVAKKLKSRPLEILSRSRRKDIVRARSIFLAIAQDQYSHTNADLARFLSINESNALRGAERGRQLLKTDLLKTDLLRQVIDK